MNANVRSPDSPASTGITYRVDDWREQYQGCRTGLLKQLGYHAIRPLFAAEARRRLTKASLGAYSPVSVLRERGFPIEARRRWALAHLDVSKSVILVQGTGTGWDVLTWARFHPKRIVATDLFPFDGWDEIARYCRATWNVPCEFRQAALEDHAFLAPGSVDVCVSDAVFEHCRDLGAVLAETSRLLRSGGRLYASYGPLWFCGGGDHYSGRGGLGNLYNHLLLASDEYQTYVDEHREEVEGFQHGHRYIELDLFSKLTSAEYLAAFRRAGFSIDALIVELSSPALRFRRTFPSRYRQLLAATTGRCSPDDLIVKGNLIRLTRC